MGESEGSKYAVLVLAGPGERELTRIDDLLDSLFHYEPDCPALVVVSDGHDLPALERRLRGLTRPGCQLAVLDNPCRERGGARQLLGGLAAGHRWVLDNLQTDFVLKVDPDSLFIGPFAERLRAYLAADPQAGMVGSHYHARRPQPAYINYVAKMRKLSWPVGLWRKPRWHVRFGWWGHARKLRVLFAQALRHGYRFGENCLGGGYALTTESLRRLRARGVLEDPLFFLDMPTPCDLTFSMLVKAVGLKIVNFDGPGEPFSIWWGTLADEPARLVADGHAIIHSVKSHPGWTEEELRQLFRTQRQRSPN